MPPEQGLRSDDPSDGAEASKSDFLCLNSESAALLLAESQSLAAVEFLQYTDLFLKILDDVLLMTIHPACDTGDHESQVVHRRRLLTR